MEQQQQQQEHIIIVGVDASTACLLHVRCMLLALHLNHTNVTQL